MAYINVRNTKGTADDKPLPGYSSWLDFWEKKRGVRALKCEGMPCARKPDLGGHVIKDGEGGRVYILPICNEHNNKPESETYRAWENDLILVS
jgi:hypothetical protein